jgi:hypothetical protein
MDSIPIVEDLQAAKEVVDTGQKVIAAASTAIQSNISVAGLALGGATAIGAGVYFTYKKIAADRSEKHLKKIKKANALFTDICSKISIPGFSSLKETSLRPIVIFHYDKQGKIIFVESTHFNKANFDDIVNTRVRYPETSLQPCGEHLINAMKALLAYYDKRTTSPWYQRLFKKNENVFGWDEDDDISCTLRHLIHVIRDNCMTMDGYEKTIAIIDHLQKFINHYGTQKGLNSDVFQCMEKAYVDLENANLILKNHIKKGLPLGESITAVFPVCIATTHKLMINFAKLISSPHDWDKIDSVTADFLSQGILDDETPILDSFFKTQLADTAITYLNTIGVSTKKTAQDPLPLTDVNKSIILKYLNNNTHQITPIFEKCKNFITLTSAPKKNSYKIGKPTLVTATADIQTRSALLYEINILPRKILSIYNFCSLLEKNIKDLGDQFDSNPNSRCFMDYIIHALFVLANDMKRSAGKIEKELNELKHSNSAKNMLTAQQETLEQDFKRDLATIQGEVFETIMKVIKSRKKSTSETAIKQIDLDKHKTLQALHSIAITSGLENEIKKRYDITSASIRRLSDSKNKVAISNNSLTDNEIKYSSDEERKSNDEIIPREISIYTIDSILQSIDQRLKAIKSTEATDKKIPYYGKLYTALTELRYSVSRMENEKMFSRLIKSNKTAKTTYTLCHHLLAYLNKTQTLRNSGMETDNFVNTMQNELTNAAGFASEHRSKLWEILRIVKEIAYCLPILTIPFVFFHLKNDRGGFGKTETAALTYQIGETCDRIKFTPATV